MMKKNYLWLFAILFVAAFALTACGSDDDETGNGGNGGDGDPVPPTLQVNEANLKGTWDGKVDHDFAQSYYQRWRIQFDGKNYTSWHTHQMVGTAKQADLGLQTVGSKSQGTWEYVDGALVLTPKKMWASYYQTADDYQTMSNLRYVFYSYNTETMEADEWYEFSEASIQSGIERDLKDGSDFYLRKFGVVSFTEKVLSLQINRDVFKLEKQ